MRVLVTGGAGFIGSHVVDRLVKDGHTVAVLDDLSTGDQSNVNSAALLMPVDVTVFDDTLNAVIEFQPGAILHLAAQVSVPHSFADPAGDAVINIVGTLNLLRAARATAQPPRFVFISSGGAVYGDAYEFPSRESTRPSPATPYGIAKLAAEHYVRLLSPAEHAILRFSNVYGPRQSGSKETGVCAVFTSQVIAGEPLTIFGDGTQTRDYVYVEDVARAVVAALTAGSGEVLNICSGVETSAAALARLVIEAAGSGNVTHLPPRQGDVPRSWLAPDLAARSLGWRPEVDLQEGVRRTLASVRPAMGVGG